MYEAFAAGTFLVLKWAFIKSQERIFLEFSAFSAEFAVGSMMVLAVNVYHIADGFLFAFHSFVRWVRRLRLHFESLSEPKDGAAHKDLPLTLRDIRRKTACPSLHLVVSVLHHSTIFFSDSSLFFKAEFTESSPK